MKTIRLKHNNSVNNLMLKNSAEMLPVELRNTLSGLNTSRHICLAIIMLLFTLCAFTPSGHAQSTKQQYGITVAVLPFEVFSVEKEPKLGADVAALIAKHLKLNPSVLCIDDQQIQSALQPDEYVAVSEERLRQLAKLLNANFIIMGTITKIRSEHSIDVEMFNTASTDPHFKTFSEGLEIESIIETVATTLDQEIMDSAEQIPTIERPRVNVARQAAPQTPSGGFDVERELVTAFGPMEEASPKKTGTEPVKSENSENISPTLTEKPLQEEPETVVSDGPPVPAIAPDEPPPASAPDKPAPASSPDEPSLTEDEVLPQKKTTSTSKKDSGFFSFSKAISINADNMEYDNKANKALFKGNVVARQADIVMFANSMHVSYSKDGGLSRVDARGNVRVVQGDRIATGSSIIFNNAAQTITATGDPRVWQGDNVVHGQKITVYLKEERTVVEGRPDSRASATIYPDGDTKLP